MEIEDFFLHKSPSKDRLDLEFKTCLGEPIPKEALTAFTVSDAYR